MKDLRIEARFKNERLWQAIEERFRLAKGDSAGCVALAARTIGIAQTALSQLLNLQKSPYSTHKNRGGEPLASTRQIADFFGENVEELFPQTLYGLALPKVVVKTVESATVLSLQEARSQHLLPAVDDELMRAEDTTSLRQDLESAIRTLRPREEKLLRLRFGLDDGKERTLDECAEAFGVCPQRARQIEARALRLLRHPSRSRKLRSHIPSWRQQ